MSSHEKKPESQVEKVKQEKDEDEEILKASIKSPKIPCGRVEDQFPK